MAIKGKGFEAFVDKVKKSEGLAWNKDSTEGAHGSYCGITYDAFQEYLAWSECGFPEFKHSSFGATSPTDAELHVIADFYDWYLHIRYKLSCIPDWLIYPVADWTIQSGSHAIKPLQRAAGIDVDGVIGPNTAKALSELFTEIENDPDHDADANFVNMYCDARKAFMTDWLNRTGNMERLGKGIYARLKKIRNIALTLCEDDEAADDLKLPTGDVEESEPKVSSQELAELNSKLDAILAYLRR